MLNVLCGNFCYTHIMKNKASLIPLLLIVACNYVAQIPYSFHQYNGHVNPVGSLLILVTLLWFLLGYILIQKHKRMGYWLLLSFLVVQCIFYFFNEVFLSFYGYGILYHFFHSKDIVLWIVFFIGDLNFIAACYYVYYLIKRKSLFSK